MTDFSDVYWECVNVLQKSGGKQGIDTGVP
jgi:hypothetical protein